LDKENFLGKLPVRKNNLERINFENIGKYVKENVWKLRNIN
jgi:hypothetical protein